MFLDVLESAAKMGREDLPNHCKLTQTLSCFCGFQHVFPLSMANLRYPANNEILSWLVDNPIDTKRLR